MKKTNPLPESGVVFQFSYPFVRDIYCEQDEEGTAESPTWTPGVRMEDRSSGKCAALADGIGQQIVTVVSTFKPGKFAVRVFYTRQWRDPSGKLFGKSNLRILSYSAFTGLVKGYRHEFELSVHVKGRVK